MSRFNLSQKPKCAYSALMMMFVILGMQFSQPVFGQGAKYEQPPVLRASSLLPQEMQSGSSYKLKEAVGMQGMLYSFQLWSRYGWYQPESLSMLRIRLAEIRALDTLTAMQQDPLFMEGVSDQVVGTAEATVNAVKHPFKTVANIPLGLAKFGKQVEAKVEEGDTLTDDQIRGVHEKAKRELAASLGVDPYSENVPLQNALNTVATNKNRGALVTRIGTAFIPAVGPALGAAQLNKGLQDRLVSLTASELQMETRKNLTNLGAPKADVDLFMRNPGYTPSRRAAISDAMLGLSGVKGVQNYLRAIQEVPRPEVALFYQQRIQLAERFHQTVRPLSSMTLVGVTPIFLDKKGDMVGTVPVDYAYWNEDLARRIAQVRKTLGKATCDLHITGSASDLVKQNLADQGLTLHENWGTN